MEVDGLDRTVHIKMVIEHSISQKTNVIDANHEPSWIDLIIEFISNGNLPSNDKGTVLLGEFYFVKVSCSPI